MMESTTGQVYVEMPACEAHLFQKLQPGEPRFTLRAGDVSASIVVEFWALLNLYIRMRGRAEVTPDKAIAEIEAVLFKQFPTTHEPIDDKISGAFNTAVAMAKWEPRKVAD